MKAKVIKPEVTPVEVKKADMLDLVDVPLTQKIDQSTNELPVIDIPPEKPIFDMDALYKIQEEAEEHRLLDEYAGQAMQRACMDSKWANLDQMADWCFSVSNAMLRARGRAK